MTHPGATPRSTLHMLPVEEIPPVLSEVMDVRIALSRPNAAIFRGPLLTAPSKAYERLRRAFPEHSLILDEDPEVGARLAIIPNLSNSVAKAHPIVAVVLLLLTLATTTVAGSIYAVDAVDGGTIAFLRGLPYALGLMAILGVHEMGHYLAARRHKMSVSLPYFIPAPSALGTFGAFIRLKSPAPNRTALFDTAVSGPLAGLVVAIPVLCLGLRSSEITTTPLVALETPLDFGQPNINASLLLGILARLALPAPLAADTVVLLSPLAFAGWLGLFVTALNLLPIGQLDGGHIIQAMFGRRIGEAIGSLATGLLLLVAIFFVPALLLWALIVLLVAGRPAPTLNDLTPISVGRRLTGLGAIILFLSIILPYPTAGFSYPAP